jgi:hypothetical protein
MRRADFAALFSSYGPISIQVSRSINRLFIAILLAWSALPARAAEPGSIFGQGSTQFSLIAGSGYAFNSNYFVFGAGLSYYVLDGLGAGLSFEKWSGGNPGITKYTPFVQYVFLSGSPVLPYIGGFYRHTSFDGLPGINSVGARAGVYIAAGTNAYLGVGITQENYLDCQVPVYSACSASYVDLSLIFGF